MIDRPIQFRILLRGPVRNLCYTMLCFTR